MVFHVIDHGIDAPVENLDVGIDKKHVLGPAGLDADIVRRREAAVLLVLDQANLRERLG